MKRTQIYIAEKTHEAAKDIAEQSKRPLAALFRFFIEQGLQEEKRHAASEGLDRIATLALRGGPKDLSKRMDTYLYDR